MSSYEEEKKKNDGKHDGEESSVNTNTDTTHHDFGSVSQDIDNILGDSPTPHDKKDAGDFEKKEEFHHSVQPEPVEKTDQIQQEPPYQIEKPENTHHQEISNKPFDNSKENISQKEDVKPLSRQEQQPISSPTVGQDKQFVEKENSVAQQPISPEKDQKEKKRSLFGKTTAKQDKNKGKDKTSLFGKKQDKTTLKKQKKPVKTEKKSFSILSKKNESQHPQQQPVSKDGETLPVEKTIRNETENVFQKPIYNSDGAMDDEVLRLLAITDDLLGKLPEEVISEFAASEDFRLYKRVMDKYNIGK